MEEIVSLSSVPIERIPQTTQPKIFVEISPTKESEESRKGTQMLKVKKLPGLEEEM